MNIITCRQKFVQGVIFFMNYGPHEFKWFKINEIMTTDLFRIKQFYR